MALKVVDFKLHDIEQTQDDHPFKLFQDLYFDDPIPLTYITFQNFYCAFLTIKHRLQGEKLFRTVVKEYRLMEDPHFENDAQQWHTIDVRKTFKAPEYELQSIHQLRLYYIQPSPNWLRHYIHRIQCYIGSPSPQKSLSESESSGDMRSSQSQSSNDKPRPQFSMKRVDAAVGSVSVSSAAQVSERYYRFVSEITERSNYVQSLNDQPDEQKVDERIA